MTSTLSIFTLLGLLVLGAAAQESESPPASPWSAPEGLVRELYKEVTFEAGKTPDWNKVRSMFLKDAVVVLRTSRTATTVFSLDGFVQDFVDFIENSGVKETGFTEKILSMKSVAFRDIAHVWVVFESGIPGSSRPPQEGLDSFQLVRKEDRWWIVSVTNDRPNEKYSIPDDLKS